MQLNRPEERVDLRAESDVLGNDDNYRSRAIKRGTYTQPERKINHF